MGNENAIDEAFPGGGTREELRTRAQLLDKIRCGREQLAGVGEGCVPTPEAGWREGGDAAGIAGSAGLQRDKAAEGVAGNVRALEALVTEERAELFTQRLLDAATREVEVRRLPVTGEIDEDD